MHTCIFHDDHDMVNDVPIGNVCGAPAIQEIYWKDGRVSPACHLHGWQALDSHARTLVKKIVLPRSEGEWRTQG